MPSVVAMAMTPNILAVIPALLDGNDIPLKKFLFAVWLPKA